MKNIPKHVAIIPDGNRRWAKKRNLQSWFGHQTGTKALEKILDKTQELKIPYFTFWGGSYDNLTKRPKTEINFLFKIYTNRFRKILEEERIHQNKVKINVFGRWREILPKETQKTIEKTIKATKNYNKYFLTILLAYNGIDEMIDCIQNIIKINNPNLTTKITSKLIKENLWTKDLPPVDLVIRTGCQEDPHFSAGFMMWDTAYSQLYFTKTLFPDFTPEEFEKIIKDYNQRQRRFGK